MKKNMGNIDKVVRILIAIVFTVLYFTGKTEGTLGVILMAVSGVFVLTSLIGFCPLYTIFGVKTCPVKK